MKGSSTTPSPSGSTARTTCRMNACGLSDGWGATSRSSRRVGADEMTSPNGSFAEIRRRPPVLHRLRFSLTVPSQGLRKSPHGSH